MCIAYFQVCFSCRVNLVTDPLVAENEPRNRIWFLECDAINCHGWRIMAANSLSTFPNVCNLCMGGFF
jgi:hypothetical protein